MPETTIVVFRNETGEIPLKEWLDALETSDPRAFAKCLERILRLSELGHELRRPHADSLRDGIHELRARVGRVQYRILYFFHGQHRAVLSHGITKEREVPAKEIDQAIRCKKLVENDFDKHTAEWQW